MPTMSRQDSEAFQRELQRIYDDGRIAGLDGLPFSWPTMSEVRADAWRRGWATGMLEYRRQTATK